MLDWLERTCRRCDANLDGLRIGGPDAINLALAYVQDDSDIAAVLALLLAESVSNQPATAEQAVALLRDESPEARRAAWWGLRLANPQHVEPHLRALLGKPAWDYASAAALDVLAFHRLPFTADLGAPPDDADAEITWFLAEAGGRMRGAWKAAQLKRFIGHACARVPTAALRASARCGLRELVELCREATADSGPPVAISFLGVVGSAEDLPRLQRVAQTSDPASAAAAVQGLGRLGLPVSMVDRRQQSGTQQFGQLSGIDPVTLITCFQQGVSSWITHHDFRDVRLEKVVQPGGPGSFFKGDLQGSRSPCTNCRMVMAFVSRINSITSLPAEFSTAIEIVSV